MDWFDGYQVEIDLDTPARSGGIMTMKAGVVGYIDLVIILLLKKAFKTRGNGIFF